MADESKVEFTRSEFDDLMASIKDTAVKVSHKTTWLGAAMVLEHFADALPGSLTITTNSEAVRQGAHAAIEAVTASARQVAKELRAKAESD